MGLQLPRVTKCCFCIRLKTASLLIGYFSIVIDYAHHPKQLIERNLCGGIMKGIIDTQKCIKGSFPLVPPHISFMELKDRELTSCLVLAAMSFYTYKVATVVEDLDEHPNPQHTPDEVKKVALSLYISIGYYMLVFLYSLVINVLLVIGVHGNKPQYLNLYINTAYCLLVIASVLIVLSCVFMGLIATIPLLKWTFILLICIIIVRSTYLDMEEQNKPRTFEMQDLYMPQRAPLIV